MKWFKLNPIFFEIRNDFRYAFGQCGDDTFEKIRTIKIIKKLP